MVKTLRHILAAAAAVLTAAVLVACADDPRGGSRGAAEALFTVRLLINTGTGASRALPWTEDPATAAEDILSPADLRILIFDASSVLLKEIRPSELDRTSDGVYTLSATFSTDIFDDVPDDATIGLSVMILANLEGVGGTYGTYYPGSTVVADVSTRFLMSPSYYPTTGTGIPMYGLARVSALKADLLEASTAPAAEIFMLRSLCKLEVTDATVKDAEGYPRVLGVELAAFNSAAFLEYPGLSYPAGIDAPNLCGPVEASGTLPGHEIAAAGLPLYRFYCPESPVSPMKFLISAQLAADEAPQVFVADMASADYAGTAGGDVLLRNHIYRYNIRSFSTGALLTVTVADWDAVRTDIDFSETVSMAPDGLPAWSFDASNFALEPCDDGSGRTQLSIYNATGDFATCTFYILSPVGAQWSAYFIPGENGVDAFEFVDVDAAGNYIPGSAAVSASGRVGERAVIHIRGKGAADAYDHYAELVVVVRSLDGSASYAPLDASQNTRFLIYRQRML